MIRDRDTEELRGAGYGARQIEAMQSSKWQRWADGQGITLLQYIQANPDECSREQIRLLTQGKI